MFRMHKLALRAIAKLTRVDLQAATKIVRINPIMDSEIQIEEELINLKESMDSYHHAEPTLRRYPNIRLHVVQERKIILEHCIGLVNRMLAGRKLPYSYTRRDIDAALRRLIQLTIDDCRRTGRRIDRDVMEICKPFMSVRQRIALREWGVDLLVQASQWPKIQSFGIETLRRVRS